MFPGGPVPGETGDHPRVGVEVRVLAGLLAAGCATGAGPERTPLPEFPRVEGEPSLYVAYPDSLQRIAVSDSNFLFGTTGTGSAELTVNGEPVEVEPNGAFLAYLPVADAGADELAGARALLFPVRWEEPFGLVVIEALASGTPVITGTP